MVDLNGQLHMTFNIQPRRLGSRGQYKWSSRTVLYYQDRCIGQLGRVPGLRVHVLNVQFRDSWQFEVQV